MNFPLYIYLAAALGFLLSAYSVYVHLKLKQVENYHAVCDLSNRVSCTKAFTSGYGEILYFPNGAYGMIFYLLISFLQYQGAFEYIYYLSILSVIGSLGLAYILYFVIKSLCVVCNTIYLVNIILLLLSYFQLG